MIILKPVKAKLSQPFKKTNQNPHHAWEYDTSWSPYLHIRVGDQQKTSNIHHRGDLTPAWNESIPFSMNGEEATIKIQCYSNSKNGPDVFMGSCDLFLTDLLNSDRTEGWFDLESEVGRSGELFMRWTVEGFNKGFASKKDRSRLFSANPYISRSGFGGRRDMKVGNAPAAGILDAPRLFLRPITAEFNVNLDYFKKMDPYVVLRIDDKDEKTQPHSKGGKRPVWQESKVFELDGDEKLLEVYFYDSDQFGDDEYIGDLTIDLQDLTRNPRGTKWFNVNRYNADGGRFQLEWNFMGSQNFGQSGISNPYNSRSGIQVGGGAPGNPNASMADVLINRAQQKRLAQKTRGAPGSRLVLRPRTARFLVNLDYMKNMDPYVVVTVGNTVRKTEVCSYGGKDPEWEEPLYFDLNGDEKFVDIQCYDWDQMKQDDYISNRQYPISEFVNQKAGKKWFKLDRHAQNGGAVMIEWEYTEGARFDLGGGVRETKEADVQHIPPANDYYNSYVLSDAGTPPQRVSEPSSFMSHSQSNPMRVESNYHAVPPPAPQPRKTQNVGYFPPRQPDLSRRAYEEPRYDQGQDGGGYQVRPPAYQGRSSLMGPLIGAGARGDGPGAHGLRGMDQSRSNAGFNFY